MLVKVRRAAQITLPAEARQRLGVREGDYLEAEVTDKGVLLKPVSVVAREKAWDSLMEIINEDKWIGPEPRPSPEEEEAQIFEVVREFRERHG